MMFLLINVFFFWVLGQCLLDAGETMKQLADVKDALVSWG